MESELTPAQIEVLAVPVRNAMLLNFAIFPVVVIVVIGLSVLLHRFLVNFFNTDPSAQN